MAVSNRPPEDAFRQQKLAAWQPIMTPLKVIVIFTAIGIAFIPAGISLLSQSSAIYESVIEYDGSKMDVDCAITNQNQGRSCQLTFNITEDVEGPLYVYYRLTNFYQNHRRYVASRSESQLNGVTGITESDLKTSCVGQYKNESSGMLINPCGFIANSFFTDIYTLEVNSSSVQNGQYLELDETNIAWDSDSDKFVNPAEISQPLDNPNQETCEESGLPADCQTYGPDPTNGKYYNFYYPDAANVQYLYQSYPDIISPIDGVTNEHFQVWMRCAALPNFKKLYGKIEGNFKQGDSLVFTVLANYQVNDFDGTKSLVITTHGEFGGKNPYLGLSYVVIGAISLMLALLFFSKQTVNPRRVADPSLLNWNL